MVTGPIADFLAHCMTIFPLSSAIRFHDWISDAQRYSPLRRIAAYCFAFFVIRHAYRPGIERASLWARSFTKYLAYFAPFEDRVSE
jgi:hypothetical protein